MTRGMFASTIVLTLALGSAWASPAHAQDASNGLGIQRAVEAAEAAAEAQEAAQTPRYLKPRKVGSSGWWTPVLLSVDAMTITAQALDVDSTFAVLDRGGQELNPLMADFAHNNRSAFVATKVGITAGLIYATHSLAKNHKVAAIVTAVAVNGAYAYVAHRNYRMARVGR